MVDQTIHLASLNIACFVTSFLLEGLQRCSGIFFNDTLELTDEDRQTAAIPFILSRATAYITSVVFKNAIQKQKLEVSLLFGTLLCALGAGLSFVSNEVIWLSISWGVFFGTGFGVVYPENLKVSQKFRSQTLLPVIYSAAASFACIILPFFMQFLVCRFGLSGCFLILSAIILNAVPLTLIAIYKIRFDAKNLKWRLRKKYEVEDNLTNKNNIEEPKTKITSDGFDNDGFELENDPYLELNETNSNVNNEKTQTQTKLNKTSSKDLLFKNDHLVIDVDHTLEHNSTGFTNEPNEVIPKHRKDTKIIITNQNNNPSLFEQIFSEEDILYETKSDSFKNEPNGSNNILYRNVLIGEAPCSQSIAKDSSCISRRRTLSKSNEVKNDFPAHIEVNVLHKNTTPEHLNKGTSISEEIQVEIHPKRASIESSHKRVDSKENGTVHIPPTETSTILSVEEINVPKNSSVNNIQQNISPGSSNDIAKVIPNKVFDEITVADNGGAMTTNEDGKDLSTKSQINVINPIRRDLPLEIRVHVVECTFTAQDIIDARLFERSKSNVKRNGYRRHSNSLIISDYDNIDFNSPHFLKKCNKPSNLGGYSTNPSSTMYLISEDDEFGSESNRTSNCGETLNETPKQTRPRFSFFEPLKKLFKPSCLVIVYSFVIHEITLVTLLLTFDDHLTDIEKAGNDATNVLAAFGLGGIFGRLSVRYCGDKLLQEGSNAAAALLFILEGAVVVGILLSTNMYWIGTFYAILGFLEIGISTAVWNLVKDYIDVDAKSILFSTCTMVCGISALFVPYTIGLTRDDLGEYDGLLQITSGLSVLCAILCYVLPRFVDHSRHGREY